MARKKGKKRSTSEAAPTPGFAKNYTEITDSFKENRDPVFSGTFGDTAHAIALWSSQSQSTMGEIKKLLFVLVQELCMELDEVKQECKRLQDEPSLNKSLADAAEEMRSFKKAVQATDAWQSFPFGGHGNEE